MFEISLVLNLEFGTFEFVSDFVLRVSDLLKLIKQINLVVQALTFLNDVSLWDLFVLLDKEIIFVYVVLKTVKMPLLRIVT